MFQGNLNDTSKSYCTFTTTDEDFGYLGLHQFTIDYLYSYCKINAKDIRNSTISSDLKNVFLLAEQSGGQSAFNAAFKGLFSSCYYYKFNLTTKVYEKTIITTDDMFDLIEKYKKLKTTEDHQDEPTRKAVVEIQNSAYRCIQIELSISTQVGSTSLPIKLQMFFKENTDAMTGKRNMTPLISTNYTGVPRRATGGKYSANTTLYGDSRESSVGQYSSPDLTGKNIKDMTSAPIAYKFDSSRGVWESGTQQVLAKLITDVDKPVLKKPLITATDTANDKDFYNPNSDNYMGGFTTGLAVPVSVEDGNPHLFGPNCITCTGGEQKIEKIRVVNRSQRSFKAGTTIMCSQLDGEWIMQDLGTVDDDAPVVAAPSTPQSWTFIKLIANSDSYFCDARHINETGGLDANYRNTVLPDKYESYSRNRFYAHSQAFAGGDLDGIPNIADTLNPKIFREVLGVDFKKLTLYNFYPEVSGQQIDTGFIMKSEANAYDFIPNNNYLVSTAFDQLGQKMGGNASGNFIRRTNVSNTQKDSVNRYNGEDFLYFWGPVFPDGYKIADVTRVAGHAAQRKAFKTNNKSYFTTPVTLPAAPSEEINPFAKDSAYLNDEDMYSRDPSNAKEIPAEVGVLSSGNPIEDITTVMSFYKKGVNFAEATKSILSSTSRLANLTDTSGVDVYNMTPVSINKIQFTPLTAEFATHADRHSFSAKRFGRNFYTNTRTILKDTYKGIPHWWGKMFERFIGNSTYINTPYPTCDVYDQSVAPSPSQASNYIILNVPYDCYTKVIPTSKPLGAVKLFRDTNSDYEGANLIGVIAAKNRFRKTGGGKINYTLEQSFGLIGENTTTRSVLDTVILALGGGSVIGGSMSSGGLSYGIPSWGSNNSDRYDSFGTTALHVRVFDAWPKEQTIYDARYFAVLHFNPGILLSLPTNKSTGQSSTELANIFKDEFLKWNTSGDKNYRKLAVSKFNYSRIIDEAKYDVDFRVPTYAWPPVDTAPKGQEDNKIIPLGTKINQFTVIRPDNEGRVNTIRRGQLLTKGGFRYWKNEIGLDKEGVTYTDIGSGFVNDQEVTISKGAVIKLKVNGDGGIVDFSFVKDDNNNESRGSGFVPSDFGSPSATTTTTPQPPLQAQPTGFIVTVPGNPGKKPAKICFKQGVVYAVLMNDEGPKERCPIQKLTTGSGGGMKTIESTISATIEVDPNSSGEYDAFYFFHNDISHTLALSYGDGWTTGFHQYLNVTIT